jgi:casein kinase II subunit alpha
MQERLTAKEAMAHPYFAPIRDEATLQQYLASSTQA